MNEHQYRQLLDRALRHEEFLAREVASARRRYEDAERQLEQLAGYDISSTRRAGCTGAVALAQASAFMSRVGEAARLQSRCVEELKQAYRKERAKWIEQRARCEALRELHDQARHERLRRTERQEQLQMDERAARQFNA